MESRPTRPDEKRKDVFPTVKDENSVTALDLNDKRHGYMRIFSENGVTLFTRKNVIQPSDMVYVRCGEYMVDASRKDAQECILRQLTDAEEWLKGEIEHRFETAMANPGYMGRGWSGQYLKPHVKSGCS